MVRRWSLGLVAASKLCRFFNPLLISMEINIICSTTFISPRWDLPLVGSLHCICQHCPGSSVDRVSHPSTCILFMFTVVMFEEKSNYYKIRSQDSEPSVHIRHPSLPQRHYASRGKGWNHLEYLRHLPHNRTTTRSPILILKKDKPSGWQQIPQQSLLCGVQAAHLTTSPSPSFPLQGHSKPNTGNISSNF